MGFTAATASVEATSLENEVHLQGACGEDAYMEDESTLKKEQT